MNTITSTIRSSVAGRSSKDAGGILRACAWIAVVGMCLVGTVALAEVPDELRVPLTGVEIAEVFPGLADNPAVRVWALKGSALDPYAVEAADTASDDPVSLGFAIIHYTTIQGSVFVPNHDGFIVGDPGSWGLFCGSGGNRFATAQAELQHGASLLGFRQWTEDGVANSAVATGMFEVCQEGAGPIDITFLGGVASQAGMATAGIVFPSPVTVDTTLCFYPVLAEFGNGATTCGPDLVLYKVRTAWNLQIAPAPGSPTFNDVPTNHLFYRQIEALAASGITGGCGGGNFCPGASLTRGEMAVFLAKALGLGWEPAGTAAIP